MSTFEEADHPRGPAGRFAAKPSAPESDLDLSSRPVEVFAPDDVLPEDLGLTSAQDYTSRIGACPTCGELRSGQVGGGATFMPGTACSTCGTSAPDLVHRGTGRRLGGDGTVSWWPEPDGPEVRVDQVGWDDAVAPLADPDAVRDALRENDPDFRAAQDELAAAEREQALRELDSMW